MSKPVAVIIGHGKVWNLDSQSLYMLKGAQNLGGLISRALAKDGFLVVVHYNSASSKAESEATISEINSSGGEAIGIQADLTKIDEIIKLFVLAKSKGKVTVAIYNVGKVLKKPIAEVNLTLEPP